MIYACAYLRGCIILALFNKLWYTSSSLFLITIPHNANYHLIMVSHRTHRNTWSFF